MHFGFIHEIKDELTSSFSNKPPVDEEEDISETKTWAQQAHADHFDETHARVKAHGHLGHEVSAGLVAVLLLHKVNKRRESEGKKPIGKVKEFLAFVVAMQAEKAGENAFNKYEARKQAHEIANQHGARIGEADEEDDISL